ncbi:MAG: hypothetical protein KAJ07_03130 [Planctomycetes bacterium]|nr:hypothetical protein [Planctomycetota bacterium]
MELKKRSVKLAVILLCMAAIAGWYITSGIAEETNTTTNTNDNTNNSTAIINQFPNDGMQVNPIVHLGGYGLAADPLTRHRTDEAIGENYRLLVSIDKKIDIVNARLARIEKALNLKPIKAATIHGQKRSLRYGTN